MTYDFRERVYRTTAGTLARILFGTDGAGLSRGVYEGTRIPVRRVPDDAPVALILRRAGGRVEDEQGGWIADRFGPAVGVREARRCAAELERQGILPE